MARVIRKSEARLIGGPRDGDYIVTDPANYNEVASDISTKGGIVVGFAVYSKTELGDYKFDRIYKPHEIALLVHKVAILKDGRKIVENQNDT